MSRTMDAFDLRMQTFGGTQKDVKHTHFDKFIQEKRGFIRLSNGYANNDCLKVVEHEHVKPLIGSGPAFKTSYDNKYKQSTSFASDTGRYKNPLNVNQHTKEELQTAEKVDPLYELKDSNIRFVHPELGEPESPSVERSGSKSMQHRSITS